MCYCCSFIFEIFAFIYLFLKLSLCSSNNFLMNKKNKPPFCDESLTKMSFFTGLCWNFEGIASGRRRLWIGLRLNKFCRLQHPRRIKAIIFRMVTTYRSSHPEVFYEKCVLKICSKFTREHPCRSMVFSCKFAAYFLNTFLGTPLRGCFCIYVHFTGKIIVLSQSKL